MTDINDLDPELRARFCRFHKGLASVDLVECAPEACVIDVLHMQGLSILDPQNVTVKRWGSVEGIIRLVGRDKWPMLKNRPEALRKYLNAINIVEDIQILGEGESDEIELQL